MKVPDEDFGKSVRAPRSRAGSVGGGASHGLELVDALLGVALSDLPQGLVLVPARLHVLGVQHVVLGLLGLVSGVGQLGGQRLREEQREEKVTRRRRQKVRGQNGREKLEQRKAERRGAVQAAGGRKDSSLGEESTLPSGGSGVWSQEIGRCQSPRQNREWV